MSRILSFIRNLSRNSIPKGATMIARFIWYNSRTGENASINPAKNAGSLLLVQ